MPGHSCRSSLFITIKAEASEDIILFLYFGRKANDIAPATASSISSTLVMII
jgi:hypothetical protein